MNIKNIKLLGIILAVCFLGMIVYRGITEKNNSPRYVKDTPEIAAVFDQRWGEYAIAETGLAIYAPENLKHIPTKLDDNAKETLKSYSSYEYVTTPFGLRINYVVAKYDLDPTMYAKLVSDQIKNSGTISGYNYTTAEFEFDNIKGVIVKGEGVENNKSVYVRSAVGADKEKMWEVTVSYQASSQRLEELTEKIFTSIKFQKSSSLQN